MFVADKFSREEIERIKGRIKDHLESFRNNVSLHKLCQIFPQAKLHIEYFTKELRSSPSKTECFQIICSFLFAQQNSETFEYLEQLLKQQRHWILKDIFRKPVFIFKQSMKYALRQPVVFTHFIYLAYVTGNLLVPFWYFAVIILKDKGKD